MKDKDSVSKLYRKAKSLKSQYPAIRDVVRTNKSIGLELRNKSDMPQYKDRGDARIFAEFVNLATSILDEDEWKEFGYEAFTDYDAIKIEIFDETEER